LCDDLMFTSKVTATARAHDIAAFVSRNSTLALIEAFGKRPACIIVDLHLPSLDLPAFLNGLRKGSEGARPRVIGFGSHVDLETLKAARAAGCDLVMPRSQFTKELESKLSEWAS
jgi:DNA-binding response OmpR family regulator